MKRGEPYYQAAMSFADIKKSLRKVGVGGVTITETSGYGRQGGHVDLIAGPNTRWIWSRRSPWRSGVR